jgi:hypothetical protein
MSQPLRILIVFLLISVTGWADEGSDIVRRDPRNLLLGLPIPSEGYCDQPYIAVTREGHWS